MANTEYLKPFSLLPWNKPTFDENGFLLLVDNCNPKSERSYVKKADIFSFACDWLTGYVSGSNHYLLFGAKSLEGVVDIKKIDKKDDKWAVDEEYTKDANAKFSTNRRVSLLIKHIPHLQDLARYLYEKKVFLKPLEPCYVSLNDKPEEFIQAIAKAVETLAGDTDLTYLDLPTDLKQKIEAYFSPFNLIVSKREHKEYNLPAKGVPPYYEEILFNTTEIQEEKKSTSTVTSRSTIIKPTDRLDFLLEQSANREKVNAILSNLGLELNPTQQLSLLLTLTTGTWCPPYSQVKRTQTNENADDTYYVAINSNTDTTLEAKLKVLFERLDVFQEWSSKRGKAATDALIAVLNHPKFSFSSTGVASILADDNYGVGVDEIYNLTARQLNNLAYDLNNL